MWLLCYADYVDLFSVAGVLSLAAGAATARRPVAAGEEAVGAGPVGGAAVPRVHRHRRRAV